MLRRHSVNTSCSIEWVSLPLSVLRWEIPFDCIEILRYRYGTLQALSAGQNQKTTQKVSQSPTSWLGYRSIWNHSQNITLPDRFCQAASSAGRTYRWENLKTGFPSPLVLALRCQSCWSLEISHLEVRTVLVFMPGFDWSRQHGLAPCYTSLLFSWSAFLFYDT